MIFFTVPVHGRPGVIQPVGGQLHGFSVISSGVPYPNRLSQIPNASVLV